MQKNRRDKKSIRIGRSNSDDIEKRNDKGGNASQLEPIYENDPSSTDDGFSPSYSFGSSDDDFHDPMREFMSRTIMKHIDGNSESLSSSSPSSASDPRRKAGSLFQIVADNAPTHPEFIVSKGKASRTQKTGLVMTDNRWEDSNQTSSNHKSSSSQRQQRSSNASKSTFPSSLEGRWGSEVSPNSIKKRVNNFSNDSNSSINTGSTSSLTLSLCDDDAESLESFTETTEALPSTTREIIDRASDVVAGKYDYNPGSFSNLKMAGFRRQRRRSSMPTSLDIPPAPPKGSTFRSASLTDPDSSTHSAPAYRSASLAYPESSTHSAPAYPEYDIPLESSSSSVAVDEYGIPIRPRTSGSGTKKSRRRRERRSSMPTRHDLDSDSNDGVQPIVATQSASIHNNGDPSPTTTAIAIETGSVPVDKFGILITQPSSNKKKKSTRRRRERRSSMPTQCYNDMTSSSEHSSTSIDSSSAVAVDEFGIPIVKPTSSNRKKITRRRRERRSSMPTQSYNNCIPPASPSISATPLDKSGMPIRSALSRSNEKKERQESTRSVSFDLPPLEPPKITTRECVSDDDIGDLSVDEYGIPISHSNAPRRQQRQQRRSSMPTSSGSISSGQGDPVDTSGPLSRRAAVRRGRRSSMTSASPSYISEHSGHSVGSETVVAANGACKASETRFLSGELQTSDKTKKKKKTKNTCITNLLDTTPSSSSSSSSAPINRAPIRPTRVPSVRCLSVEAPVRPTRVPSIGCFSARGKKESIPDFDLPETEKRNASFDLSTIGATTTTIRKPTMVSIAEALLKKPLLHHKAFDASSSTAVHGTTGAPMRPKRVPSVDAFGNGGANANKNALQQIAADSGRSNARWGDSDGNLSIISKASSNSLQPQDGQWWL